MAFVVLTTTMSFTVDMHYCGEALVDFSFFTKAEGCGMEKQHVPVPCGTSITKKSCCSNQQLRVEGQEDVITAFSTISFEQQTFVAAFCYTYSTLFKGLNKNFIPFKEYSPPFVERDILTLYETYLI